MRKAMPSAALHQAHACAHESGFELMQTALNPNRAQNSAPLSARADSTRRSRITSVTTELWLIRHGETEWSKTGQHTGRTDLPLTPNGVAQARELAHLLAGQTFGAVYTSPLQRASETCRLAGFAKPIVDPGLQEWDYGAYEGKTSKDIRKERPDWDLWRDGVPDGETIADVAARSANVIARASAASETAKAPVALFAHGHVLRILATCWLGLEPDTARLFALSTASVSILSYDRETRVMSRWNQTP